MEWGVVWSVSLTCVFLNWGHNESSGHLIQAYCMWCIDMIRMRPPLVVRLL
ncbi:hypothetical protein RJ641_008044 [Dillenia turbinata]|uniref:Uncharacterized protein n=1 Tax=Dillenia turbinata TaxID=194707 RepID=A0AAN8Z8K0_9MAGN